MLKLRITLLSNYLYVILLCLVGIISIVRISLPKKTNYSVNDTYLTGTLIKKEITPDKVTLYIKNKETVIGYFYIDNKQFKEVSLGDKLIIKGKFSRVSKSRTKNTFNYRKYLERKNIFYIVEIDKYKVISKNKNIYYKIKDLIYKRVGRDAYLNTFLLGNKTYLDKEVKNSYQEIGISHLFAISGMHISILSMLLLKILKKKDRSYFIVSIFLLLYLFLIETSASSIRGVLFFILFSINKIFYFYIPPIKIFILTLVIVLLINPFYIFDIGFLYSFSISFSLLFLSEELKGGNYFKGLLKVSFLSFLISIPISLYSFCQINLLSILYNLFYVPFISLILFPLTLIRFIVPLKIDFLINILEKSSLFLSKINTFKFIFYKGNIIIYILYFLFIIVFLIDYKKRRKKRFFLVIIVLLVVHYFYRDNGSFIKMLDVGQGDSILVYSKGCSMLVDTGGVYGNEGGVVKNVTIPVLKSLGIKKVDKLLISHGDFDHVGDALYLVNHFKVGGILINNNEANYFEKELLKKKAHKAKEGLVIKCGDVSLIEINKNMVLENDSSSVYLGIYKDRRFLLMGDASSKTEEYLIKNYNLEDVDILKVGHHGSNSSSSKKFIDIVNPKISLISAGIDNKFGHPHKEIIQRLDNSYVFVNKDLGSITVNLDSLKVEVGL